MELRIFVNGIIKSFCNFWVMITLLLMYATACGVATFIENDYGTPAAKALIYNTQWFDLLHLLLVLNLIGVLIRSRAWQRKKYASVLFHSSLVVIFIGAAITRYYGFEGVMHIREGDRSNVLQSQEEFLTILAKIDDKAYRAFFPTTITSLVQKKFDEKMLFLNNELRVRLLEYLPAEDKMGIDGLKVEVSYGGAREIINVEKNIMGQAPVLFSLGDAKFGLEWGSRAITLPFTLELKDFELDRYPGSMSPSSYASEIVLIDEENNLKESHRIFMNNVLDYGGFRFFQSSYDQDELGTILSVNRDPGKIPTYIGYAMLTLGLLWSFFAKNGRFYKLGQYLKMQNLAIAFTLISAFFMSYPAYAQNIQEDSQRFDNELLSNENILDLLESLKSKSLPHSKEFGRLLVQDFGGRIKPVDTMAMEYIHKMTKKDEFLGLNNMQLFLGMMMYPNEFKKIKMIAISTPKLKEIIGVDSKDRYIAFDDVFLDGEYKLVNYLEEANRKKPSMRDKFDKDVLSVDERINVAYLIYTAQSLRVIPDFREESTTWYAPTEAMIDFSQKDTEQLRKLFQAYFASFHQGLVEDNWENASLALVALQKIQQKFGEGLLPPHSKITLEIFLNHYNIFDNLTFFYILAGVLLFVLVLVQILRNKNINILPTKVIYWVIVILVLLHTFGLGVRWYVGGHAPWSNAYESMIYIAWAAGIAGVVFFSRSFLALATASFLAGISLFVAHLGLMDPQIGNLIPVLKSYWLNIHVSIITASYGFLGLCFMLGAITLLLFVFRSKKYLQIDQTILTLHTINEMSMILGLAMLAIGNFLGGVWANESWGRYWGWDAKETWALISIAIYAVVLHIRFLPKGDNPYIFAVLSVVAFYSILMTYFGVNFYLSGLHSYAAGDPLPIPVFLYYFVVATILLIIVAARKRDLEPPKLP
ncbi:cytochrome c biogenesis protein CcsA [Helicobacter mesocricetorum]|uniref:cytochrome c biogenesis protein CcsA n=1 Tax=Helicobacter mesocricetorum TaxID=87012 RepID=UPI000CF04896|nr:cytochrome c biogenesis protein CcsA [Helicobacter mesocricetorum]